MTPFSSALLAKMGAFLQSAVMEGNGNTTSLV